MQKLGEAHAKAFTKLLKSGMVECGGSLPEAPFAAHDVPFQVSMDSSKVARQKEGEVHARTPLPSVPLVTPCSFIQRVPSQRADPAGVGDAMQNEALVQDTFLTPKGRTPTSNVRLVSRGRSPGTRDWRSRAR
jgi:hypothetical protein